MSKRDQTLRSYGRLIARPLSARKADLMDNLLPHYALQLPADYPLNPYDSFSHPVREIWLEIGFGNGEHLLAQARKNPDIGFIGVEPFHNGMASILGELEHKPCDNIRLYCGDVRDIMAKLTPASLDRVFILFPDPWPKTRHWKRRLIQPAFLDILAKLCRKDASVRFASDWADYANWTMIYFHRHAAFDWQGERQSDWLTPPKDHIMTRYQAKKLGDCEAVWLNFIRNDNISRI